MRIVVCIKQVLDPEIPPSAFHVDEAGRAPVIRGGQAAMVLDSYAANALETAIRLRDQLPGSSVTAICVANADSDDVLRRAVAFTADMPVRAWDSDWHELDALGVAHILARAIEALGGADLALCGREAGDIGEGLVGPALAEELDMPCITLARRVTPGGESLRIEREVDGLVGRVEVEPPAVITTTSSESNVPRMLKVKDLMLARRKQIRVLGARELGVEPARVVARTRLERLSVTKIKGRCAFVEGDDGRERAARLIAHLRELKLA